MDPTTVAIAVGLLTVPLNVVISAIKQEGWPKQVNALLALIICFIVGTGIVLAHDPGNITKEIADPAQWGSVSSILFATTALVYHLEFKDSPLDQALSDWNPLAPTPLTPVVPPSPAPVVPPVTQPSDETKNGA